MRTRRREEAKPFWLFPVVVLVVVRCAACGVRAPVVSVDAILKLAAEAIGRTVMTAAELHGTLE